MATTPPPAGTPPGGRPPGQPPYGPPYGAPYTGSFGNDPRNYWRYQKEQNKAAWRAQRDMWRAQRDAMRAQNRALRVPSVTGPVILISIGVIALLLITGRIDSDQFWNWYGHWWPLLLIGIGLVALAEWAIDLRREGPPTRRFGNYFGLIVLLVILGCFAGGWHHFWGPLRAQFGDDGDNFFNSLGEPEHDLDQAVLDTKIPANAQIVIQNPRGDISISSGDDTSLSVRAHQVAYASSDTSAKKIFDSQQAHVTVSGNSVLVKVDGNSSGRTNLTLVVPKTASVNITADHGGVTVAGVGGNVDAEVQHGDLETTAIQGYVHARLSNHGDFSAHDIQGDVTVEGNGGDLTISDIHGKVDLQGDFTGDTHLERASQTVRFHSSRTDLEIARLPGDLSLNGDSLHATQVVGPVRVVCNRSKDIELSQVYGDTFIQDRDARVELDMAGSFPVEVKNDKGDVEVSLPPGAAQTVDARTHNGDIVSDFPLEISGDNDKTMTGNIGKGGPKLVLSTEHADLRLRKGDDAPPLSTLSAPSAPAAPKAPSAPGVPHLKASTGKAETPVAQ